MKNTWFLLAISLAILPLGIATGMNTSPAHVGLDNLGNTCYMNAMLQCLLRTQPLHDALVRQQDEVELSYNESTIPAKDKDKFNSHKKTLQEFITLNKSFHNANSAVQPTNFYDAFFNSANINGSFNNGKYRQEDADEAIKVLFDAIFLEITTKQATENTAYEFFYPFKISEKIGHFFTGEEVSILKRDCKHNSFKNAPFQSLSIELSDNNESNLTLEKLLTEMFKEEILTEGENLLECEFCEKGSRYDLSDGNSKFAKVKSLSKALKLNLIPEILITSLKRFEFDFETMSKNKIYTPVKFPEQLIIAPEWTTDNCPQKNATYELYGLIIHSGNANGGHYTAYVKDALTNQWWYYNDSSATQSTPKLDVPEIYGAFYRLASSEQPDSQKKTIESPTPTIDLPTDIISSEQPGIQDDPIEDDKDDEEDSDDNENDLAKDTVVTIAD